MNKTKRFLSMVMALGMSVTCASGLLAACGDKGETPKKSLSSLGHKDTEQYTYNTYTSVSPSNWNELTYQDNNDTQIMGYLGSAFYTYDFEWSGDKTTDGVVNADNIVDGGFSVEFSAATALDDVTADLAADWDCIPDDATSGYAYKVTLRDDLKWENGDEIHAEDFVYTMEQQLDPLFQNYRADSFYNGALVINNAKNYVFQGQETIEDNYVTGKYSMADLVKGEDGVYTLPDGEFVAFGLKKPSAWCSGNTVAAYANAGYLDATAYAALNALCDENGYVAITDQTIALWKQLIDTDSWGHEDESYLPCYLFHYSIYGDVDFEDVGIFAGEGEDSNELFVVLEQELQLLEDDGTAGYKVAYNFSSLPLVHKETYEACKKEPVTGSDLWTSNYHTNVETTMSWGPYKLTEFQAGKAYKLERNEYWYGYSDAKYDGQYQTDTIVCETIPEWQTAWMMFLQGGIDAIGIDVSVATDYKNSDQAYYTPDDYVGSIQLQSDYDALKNREEADVNKTILSYVDFRKALSIGLNRADFTNKCTTASLPGYGLFGIMHYFAVEKGSNGLYRGSEEAKKVLCNVYGVDVDDYDSLDDAVDSITGYDPDQAKELINSAYAAALAAGDISATDTVVLTYGSSTDNESVRRNYDYLKAAWTELMIGTELEGRFDMDFDASFGTTWADEFRAGSYDVCQGGWTGAAWDPGYLLMAYCSPSYMYSAGWNTAEHMMTATIRGLKDVDGAIVITNDANDSVEITMPLFVDGKNDWWGKLNTVWQQGALNDEFRVEIIAAIEEEILVQYYTVPYSASYAASLMSYKMDYVTYEYNTFMGYGGVRYLRYNYNDTEWAAWVAENKENGEIDYK